MIFFLGNSNKKKKLRKLKKKEREDYCRRMHLIIEARKSHERNRKDAEKYKAKGGWGSTTTMEEENLGFAVGQGFVKAVQISSNALEKLKKRHKSIEKSRKTHLARLNKARSKLKQRSRH